MIRQDGTGFATFKVDYLAAVCRPHKGEVIDCVVTSVNKVSVAPRLMSMMGQRCDLTLALPQMGFFAEAGPQQIFVSNHVSMGAGRLDSTLC